MESNSNLKKNNTPLDGKWVFVFKYGVLFWGVSTALLFQLFMYFSGSDGEMSLLKSLLVFPIGGIFWGLIMWYLFRAFPKKNTFKKKPK